MQCLSEHLPLLTCICPLSPKERCTDFAVVSGIHTSKPGRKAPNWPSLTRQNARDGKKAQHLARNTGDTDTTAQSIRLLEMKASSTRI